MTGPDDKTRIALLQLRYILIDGLLAGMAESDLREVAAAGRIPVHPAMSEHQLRDAIRASNAALARAAGVPIEHLPQLTAREAHDLVRRLTNATAPPNEPE